ncbi:Z-ring associated protein ZapG [Candidatus Palibaumannia cicadellinicola]|uniref:Z-ring associated protein G n=1 Tax=Candidatus Palibaumannia cicadellinicola TaxID=186490 RepID=A0A088MX51_9GAMM|nr:Z-ring associated protein ZapG [Candidatus Baumannia cicadellinicola]AIN46925.1 Putative cytochrome d ubiquinol oxidase subunit III (Cytochrome bd-I oxidase subunit III) [Candidatus Baumannia cicadellinicola]
MTWKPTLIGFLVGIIIGAIAMRFGNRKLRQQQTLQNELEKSKTELNKCRKELNSHFARSAELLDNMANSYRQLYQHMAKSSNNLLPAQSKEDNPFRYRLTEADNDQIPAEIQPWDDSSESSSEIPCSTYVSRNKL